MGNPIRDKYVVSVLGALQDTFNEDSEHFAGGIDEIDGTKYFEATMQAITFLYNELASDSKNNVEMTHLLNQLAVQMAVEQYKTDEGR